MDSVRTAGPGSPSAQPGSWGSYHPASSSPGPSSQPCTRLRPVPARASADHRARPQPTAGPRRSGGQSCSSCSPLCSAPAAGPGDSDPPSRARPAPPARGTGDTRSGADERPSLRRRCRPPLAGRLSPTLFPPLVTNQPIVSAERSNSYLRSNGAQQGACHAAAAPLRLGERTISTRGTQ